MFVIQLGYLLFNTTIMKAKTIFLTLILSVGISFQSCEKIEFGNSCGDLPQFLGSYFDIHGINVINYKKRGECCADPIGQGESVSFSDITNINIRFLVDYMALNKDRQRSVFSLMKTLNACTPALNGQLGSKTEKLNSFSIITINDFDSSHLANDTINDLLYCGKKQDFKEYLAQDTGLLKVTEFYLALKTRPVLNNEFKFKVMVELSTGEHYQANSVPFRIIN